MVCFNKYYASLIPVCTCLYFFCFGCSDPATKKNDRQTIIKYYHHWKDSAIKNGDFVAEKNCNGQYTLHDTTKFYEGIPDDSDSEEILFQYADINGDGIMDGLITFHPQQCDGGNALMWMQDQVLIISDKNTYRVTDDYFDSTFQNKLTKMIDPEVENNTFYIDSLKSGMFFGTLYKFREDDGICCPGIIRKFSVDYHTKSIKILEPAGKPGL